MMREIAWCMELLMRPVRILIMWQWDGLVPKYRYIAAGEYWLDWLHDNRHVG